MSSIEISSQDLINKESTHHKKMIARNLSSSVNITKLNNFNYSPELQKKKQNYHIKKSSTFQEDIQLIERSLDNDHSKSLANDISNIVENSNNSRKKVHN